MEEYILDVSIDDFSYLEGEQALKDIAFKVKKGEFIVLSGLSGCGKSSLLRLIVGLIPEIYEGTYNGKIKIKGKDIKAYEEGEVFKHISFVFQDPKDQFFSTRIEDEIALVGENLGMDREALVQKVEDIISLMSLNDLRNKTVFELSGGQKQRVAIGSSLVFDTDIIIFDEPSASLDYQSTWELQKKLQQLKNMGKTIIVVEHRLFYLTPLCDRLLFMKDKTIVSEHTREALNHTLRKKLELRCFSEAELKAEKSATFTKNMLVAKDIEIKIKEKVLAKGINFTLSKGEVMAVLGENGVGKSTFANQLSGLYPLKGYTSWGKNKKQRLKATYHVMQDVDTQIFYDTVENELIIDHRDKYYLERAEALLKLVDLWDKRMEHPQELSTGEKQRLSLITAMCHKRELFILDEPTAGLDYKRMHVIADLIIKISQETPVVLITHDLELLVKCANTALLLNGKDNPKIPIKGNEARILAFLNR